MQFLCTLRVLSFITEDSRPTDLNFLKYFLIIRNHFQNTVQSLKLQSRKVSQFDTDKIVVRLFQENFTIFCK